VLETGDLDADVVVTVCDRAHEELAAPPEWLHWSVPDPVALGTRAAFDDVLTELDERIASLTNPDPGSERGQPG
jgi:hypothetical protein